MEVVVVLRPGADVGAVTDWLAGQDLEVIPLKAGLLAAGAPERVKALRVPEVLREHVESLAIVPPKRFHDGAD